MDVGVFFAWDFLFIIGMSVGYWFTPKSLLKEKYEYIKFLLVSLSIIFFITVLLKNIIDPKLTETLLYIFALPVIFLIHAIYPFRRVRRNQNVSFFLFCFSMYVILLFGSVTILGLIFGGSM